MAKRYRPLGFRRKGSDVGAHGRHGRRGVTPFGRPIDRRQREAERERERQLAAQAERTRTASR